MTELHEMTATAVVELLKAGSVSALEVVDAEIQQIERSDNEVNALPVRDFDRARETAKRFTPDPDRDADPSYLAGLPFVVKEYNDVAGLPTTFGSPIYKDRIAKTTEVPVRTLIRNGGIHVAKSNAPEFAGANTFNPVYGATRNPWNHDFTAGGSSGGSAAALANGCAWLAMGSDLGGSLRIPASFCGVVGMRPTPGRVARGPTWPRYDALVVEGPMARTVEDVALMLDAQAGRDVNDPMSWAAPRTAFRVSAGRLPPPSRVGFSANLGMYPVEPEVVSVCRSAVQRFQEFGTVVTDVHVDFTPATSIFDVLRAQLLAVVHGNTVSKHRDQVLPAIVWNVEKGLSLSSAEYIEAERRRTSIYAYTLGLFEDIDILVCPTVAVPPFPVTEEFPKSVAGRECASYIDWMFMTWALSVTGCPIVALPCGFTATGLPVGVQVVARPGEDDRVLAAAAVLERGLELPSRPAVPRAPGGR